MAPHPRIAPSSSLCSRPTHPSPCVQLQCYKMRPLRMTCCPTLPSLTRWKRRCGWSQHVHSPRPPPLAYAHIQPSVSVAFMERQPPAAHPFPATSAPVPLTHLHSQAPDTRACMPQSWSLSLMLGLCVLCGQLANRRVYSSVSLSPQLASPCLQLSDQNTVVSTREPFRCVHTAHCKPSVVFGDGGIVGPNACAAHFTPCTGEKVGVVVVVEGRTYVFT
jgi:hypothetical protein